MNIDARSFAGLESAGWPILDEPAALVDAWRRLHYAAQAVSEVGKGWGEPRPDDSHSALTWRDGSLASVAARGGTRCELSFDPFELRILGRSLPLAPCTVAEAIAWARRHVEEAEGAPLQDAVPAPDLPDHELARGAVFGTPDRSALVALRDMYSSTDRALRLLSSRLPDRPPVLCWPHHFALALRHEARRDGGGAMESTIGVGLAVPDAVASEGYLYVSGWSRGGRIDTARLPDGLRWENTMAVFPLSGLARADGADHAASFVRQAFVALSETLTA